MGYIHMGTRTRRHKSILLPVSKLTQGSGRARPYRRRGPPPEAPSMGASAETSREAQVAGARGGGGSGVPAAHQRPTSPYLAPCLVLSRAAGDPRPLEARGARLEVLQRRGAAATRSMRPG